jgi:hypothetical protein
MPPVQPKRNRNGKIVDFGDTVRIEETAMPVRKRPKLDDGGKRMWTITGEPVYEHVEFNKLTWNVYELVANKPYPGSDDPGLFQQAYHGGPTRETHTWLHRQEAMTEKAATNAAIKLAGG